MGVRGQWGIERSGAERIEVVWIGEWGGHRSRKRVGMVCGRMGVTEDPSARPV
jgi:hypothetical protein